VRISIEQIVRFVTDKGKGMLPHPKSFVSRNCTFGGYEVRGWRYEEETAWHLKVRSISDYRYENAYVVTDGEFDPKTATLEERMVILGLIAEWEATLPKTAADSGDLINLD
jgi:hypothetical protein